MTKDITVYKTLEKICWKDKFRGAVNAIRYLKGQKRDRKVAEMMVDWCRTKDSVGKIWFCEAVMCYRQVCIV